MSINIMQGALAAAIMESRGADKDQVLSGAILSAFMPGVLGLAIPLLLTRDSQPGGAAAPTDPAAPAGPAAPSAGPATPAPGAAPSVPPEPGPPPAPKK